MNCLDFNPALVNKYYYAETLVDSNTTINVGYNLLYGGISMSEAIFPLMGACPI